LVLADAAKSFQAGRLKGGANGGIFVGQGLWDRHWRLQLRRVLT